MAFKWECVFGGCVSFGGVILGKCMQPVCCAVSQPRMRYPLVSVSWNNAFLGYLISSEEYSCPWSWFFYWGVTISIDENCGKFWFFIFKQWPVDVQGSDFSPCSWINLTIKLVHLCTTMCWHQQWLDVFVFQVQTSDLQCLHMVECCFRDFTLRRWVLVYYLLIWNCILLLYQWQYYCLCIQLMDFCRLWFPVSFNCNVLFTFLGFAATFEVSLRPMFVAFSLLCWAVLLWVWWCSSTAGTGFALTYLDSLNFCPL